MAKSCTKSLIESTKYDVASDYCSRLISHHALLANLNSSHTGILLVYQSLHVLPATMPIHGLVSPILYVQLTLTHL